MPAPTTERPRAASPRSLSGLQPFLRPYRLQIALAGLFLVLAAVSTLVFPMALRSLTMNASSFAMPLLFGSIGAVTGTAGLFWIVAGVLGVGARAVPGLRKGVAPHG